MRDRKSIGKSKRFRIFARDNFTCQYCGHQSDKVKLEIDHIIAVVDGGGNDDSNLRTSCEACNRGKSDKPPDSFASNEPERLRLAQERREQEEAAHAARIVAESRLQFKGAICDYWCQVTGRNQMNTATLNVVTVYAHEFGAERVFDWIDRAASNPFRRCSDVIMGKYISGIKRHYLEGIDK